MNVKIVLLPGDGIGPEVVNEARLVLDAVAKLFGHTFEYSTHLLGGGAIDATGTAMRTGRVRFAKPASTGPFTRVVRAPSPSSNSGSVIRPLVPACVFGSIRETESVL